MQSHLLYTGIGGACCARHGCWVPHSIVDFENGEGYVPLTISACYALIGITIRQRNMDYCVCQSLKYNTKGLRRATLYYDIMCQYWINLAKRFAANPHLSMPEGLCHVSRAIGLFHVHGHKDECYARYASAYIPGAGMVDGEIIETLWEPLNPIAPSTRRATPEHRREIIDDHMGDSNWKKMLRLGETSPRSLPYVDPNRYASSGSYMCKVRCCQGRGTCHTVGFAVCGENIRCWLGGKVEGSGNASTKQA